MISSAFDPLPKSIKSSQSIQSIKPAKSRKSLINKIEEENNVILII